MINAILLRSRMTGNCHVRFWSRVERSDLLGLDNKSWNDTAKRGLLITKPLYFAQIQLYMAYLNLEQCLFTALNKDTSELYFELIPFDSEVAQRYSDRAVQIIKASERNELLPCISSDPAFFRCKMCGFKDVCRQNEK